MYRSDSKWLDLAAKYAELFSGCRKVRVGAVIIRNGKLLALGANQAVPNLCQRTECMRVQKYGEDSKLHRLPEDCRSIHSEVDAICSAGRDLNGAVMYITRYPCEACARAIVQAGIKYVIYGRKTEISKETKRIFTSGGVAWDHYWDYEEDDTTR